MLKAGPAPISCPNQPWTETLGRHTLKTQLPELPLLTLCEFLDIRTSMPNTLDLGDAPEASFKEKLIWNRNNGTNKQLISVRSLTVEIINSCFYNRKWYCAALWWISPFGDWDLWLLGMCFRAWYKLCCYRWSSHGALHLSGSKQSYLHPWNSVRLK